MPKKRQKKINNGNSSGAVGRALLASNGGASNKGKNNRESGSNPRRVPNIPVSRIRATVRKIWWMYSPVRRQALKDADGACQQCGQVAEKLQVHHTTQLGAPKNWNKWIRALFLGEQIAICHDCHKKETKKERKK